MSSPFVLSKKQLVKEGYLVAKTEQWNPFAKFKQDLFGIIDMVAIKQDKNGVLGVQTTTGANIMARYAKALQNKSLGVWLESGNRFHLHGWRKMGKQGARKLWECRVIEMSVDNFKPQ